VCVGSDGSHYDLAVITSKIMKDRIVYDGKVKCWYIVNEKTNIWDIDMKGDRLAHVFAKDVCTVFCYSRIPLTLSTYSTLSTSYIYIYIYVIDTSFSYRCNTYLIKIIIPLILVGSRLNIRAGL
jgi:hypothetical protein